MSPPLLEVEGLVRRYRRSSALPWRAVPPVLALAGVDLRLEAGRSLGIVGESGSGKSTLARLVMGFERPDAGTVRFEGEVLLDLPAPRQREKRRDLQMVFQDPYASLDPRHKVGRIVAEPLDMLDGVARAERAERVAAALLSVGLSPADGTRYPHEFSGGQRQRIAIARALITRPKLIVADEPVSALDVSVQAQVLNLMRRLAEKAGVTYLLISHDLAVIDHATEEVAILYRGKIVESGPTAAILASPAHPYTQALKDAAPRLAPGRRRLARRRIIPVASAGEPGPGCPYAPRCPLVQPRCHSDAPALRELAPGRHVSCHFASSPRRGEGGDPCEAWGG